VGDSQLFTFHTLHPWVVGRVPANIALGVFCGLVSLYFIRMMNACEGMFAKMSSRYAKLAVGGLILSTLIFLFPSLYGEGYTSINILLDGSPDADWNKLMEKSMFYGKGEVILLIYVGCVILTKCFATASTNGGGGCGGTFAPSLFIGAFAGFLFSRLWNMYSGGVYFPEENAALLGMAGVMSGVMHAPLTGVFLIAELTAGYDLFMPLMIVSVCAYLTILAFEPHSIYGMRLARQGKLITHHTDHAVLTLMQLDSVIERDFQAVDPDMELGQIVHKISRSHNNVLPVTDAAGTLLGEINIIKIRHVVFRTELYNHFRASQLMSEPDATLSDSTPMTQVMKIFERTQADWLPVIDESNHLKGYISRKRMYDMYRKMVHDFSQD
jgi:CIC family chloride channel protein